MRYALVDISTSKHQTCVNAEKKFSDYIDLKLAADKQTCK